MTQATTKTKTAVAMALTAVVMMALGLYFYGARMHRKPEKNVSVSPAQVSHAFAYVKGSYAMWESDTPIPSEIINNPGVVGILTGALWSEIEKEEGVYDWSKIDSKISQAKKAGLKVALKIQMSPARAPDWLKNNPEVQKIEVIDTNFNHKASYCKKLSYPIFWDPIFHEKKKELIRAAGERYSNNPAVVAIMASFANFYSEDWHIPHTKGCMDCDNNGTKETCMDQVQNWLDAGYTTEKMFSVGKEIIDTTAEAFPNQALKLPLAPTHKDLDGTPIKLVEMIMNYTYSKYPKRFFAQMCGLSTGIPYANDSSVTGASQETSLYIMKLLLKHSPQIGLQMLSAASLCKEGEKCRQDNGNKCLSNDHECILMESVKIGLSYKPYFIEYWKADAANPELYPVEKYATEQMKK